MSVAEAARRAGICRETVTKGIRNGQFPGYQVGTKYVIPNAWFQRWLDGPEKEGSK